MTGNSRSSGEIEFRLVNRVGVIAQYQTGWTKEVNIIAWNGGNPKVDIRDWDPEHIHMSKGITLHEEEAKRLAELLVKRLVIKEAFDSKITEIEKMPEHPESDAGITEMAAPQPLETEAENTSEAEEERQPA